MDVDAAVSNPTLTSLAPPCALAVAWSGITFSHPNCESLSGIFDARSAVWDGSRLALSGESWEPIDGRLERLRTRGRGDGSCWRFGESLDWHVTWPVDQCPATALSASYRYEECPLFEGTDVCSATEPTACAVTALATFTPVAQAVVDTPVDAPEDIGCRNLGLDPPRRPAAAGAACFPPWTCAAGHFCSNEQDDGSCALGAAVCQPAPAFDTCGADTEPVCFCGNPAEPLDANVCQLHSLGISLETCLPRPADARE